MKIIFFVFSLTLLCAGCVEDTVVVPENTINVDSVEYYDIASANNAFAFDMYSQLARLETVEQENVFFSPHSISTAMAVCYEGAEDTTKEQISNVFYFPADKTVLKVHSKEMNSKINSESNDYGLETANAIWVQEEYPIKQQYIVDVKNYYEGEVVNLDFSGKPDASRNKINKWVEDKTNGKIKDIIPEGSITDDTRIIITNAIYFKGKWEHEFDKELTSKETFYPTDGKEISVDMMHISEYFNYGENSKAKIIELPYKGNNLSMYIVLPEDNNIKEFEHNFTIDNYTELKNTMDPMENVVTSIPKFKFETKNELSGSFIEMGIVDAFDLNRANFSGITEGPLSISSVIHQAFIDVNEEGTEAAAATMIGMVGSSSMESHPREFKADHPFMFFIEDRRTNSILFMGKIEYPEYEGN